MPVLDVEVEDGERAGREFADFMAAVPRQFFGEVLEARVVPHDHEAAEAVIRRLDFVADDIGLRKIERAVEARHDFFDAERAAGEAQRVLCADGGRAEDALRIKALVFHEMAEVFGLELAARGERPLVVVERGRGGLFRMRMAQ